MQEPTKLTYKANLSRYYQATVHKPIYIDTSETRQRDCYKLLQLKSRKVVDKAKTVLQFTHVQQNRQGRHYARLSDSYRRRLSPDNWGFAILRYPHQVNYNQSTDWKLSCNTLTHALTPHLRHVQASRAICSSPSPHAAKATLNL